MLLDSLLHFSRVGRGEFPFTEVNLDTILAQALEVVKTRLYETGVDVYRRDPLGRARGNEERLIEVFANLLTNAAKYNDKPQKVIEIGIERQPAPQGAGPDETVFYVRDNGIGITKEQMPHIFQIFRRLHARDAYGGETGVGLTVVKRIIERHGGQI